MPPTPSQPGAPSQLSAFGEPDTLGEPDRVGGCSAYELLSKSLLSGGKNTWTIGCTDEILA